jgi:hypothetical protein
VLEGMRTLVAGRRQTDALTDAPTRRIAHREKTTV